MSKISKIQKLIYDELMNMRLEVATLDDIKDVDDVLERYHEQLGTKVTEILNERDKVQSY